MLAICCLMLLAGCRFSPFTPNLKQDLNNQQGKIEELKNNQNGLMLDLMKLKMQNEIHARDIDSFQQGAFNIKQENSGTQILQGDGALILVLVLASLGMYFIYHYRTQALEHKQAAEILAQSIASRNDIDLENHVYMCALNSPAEKQVYHLMTKYLKS